MRINFTTLIAAAMVTVALPALASPAAADTPSTSQPATSQPAGSAVEIEVLGKPRANRPAKLKPPITQPTEPPPTGGGGTTQPPGGQTGPPYPRPTDENGDPQPDRLLCERDFINDLEWRIFLSNPTCVRFTTTAPSQDELNNCFSITVKIWRRWNEQTGTWEIKVEIAYGINCKDQPRPKK